MRKRGYFLKSFLMIMVIMGLTFFIKIPKVKAAGAHEFSFKMYNCYSVDQDALQDQIDDRGRVTTAASVVCEGPNGDGNLPELEPGAVVRPGQVIKFGVHYNPDLDYMDIGMQVKFFYENTAFETIKLSKYDRRTSSYTQTLAQTLGDDLVDFYPDWQITANDTGSGINYMANDSRGSAGDPLMDELDMVYYYFKVKDTAPAGTEVPFTYDTTYGNGTAFNNKSDYTVTNTTLTIFEETDEDASLATLNVKNGSTNYTLTPTFTPGSTDVTSYSTVVPNNISSVDIEATPTDLTAVLTGDGTKSLSVGDNSFDITVVPTSGEAQIYTVNVYRLNNDATLSALGLTNVDYGTFDPETTSYTATVANSITSTTVSATPTDSKATVSGTGSKDLSVGSNTVSVEVTPENCKAEYESVPGNTCTKKTYTVTVTREEAAADASLSDLTVDGSTVPGFDPDTISYTLDPVLTNKTSINIGYTTTDPNATVTGDGVKNLSLGDNSFDITVETQTGGSKVYTINVYRINNDATLSNLKLSNVNIGTFNKNTTSYTATVANQVSATTVTATPTDSKATVSGTGEQNLEVGSNTITVEVTPENCKPEYENIQGNTCTKKTYTVTVTRSEPAAGSHEFSFKMYNCKSLNESALQDQIDGSGRVTTAAHIECAGPTGDGSLPELASGSIVQPGQIIKLGVHYNPDLDHTDIGMQVKFFYDNTAFETIKFSKYDRRSSSYSDVLASELGDDLVTYYNLWQITSNDTGSGINYMANDSRGSAGDPLMDELDMIYYYFKVKDTAPINVEIPFTYDTTYGNGTAFNNKSSYTVVNSNLKVLDELDEDNTLGTLSVKHDSTNYELTPEFVPGSKDETSYSTVVPNDIDSVDIEATPYKNTSTLTGDGTKSVSLGNNSYDLTVLAQSGDAQLFTVNVYRLNNDATLSALGLTDVNIGTFDPETTTYTATVPYTTESTTVSATATDSTNATVSGTGETNLSVGENTITVEVTPENCKSEYESVPGNTCTKKTYTVTVTREDASEDATLSDLKVDGVSVPGFDPDTTEYTLSDVENDKTSVIIAYETNNQYATATGDGEQNLSVGDNALKVTVTAQDGTTTKEYTINIHRKSDDATLSSMTVTSDPAGTLSPAFDPTKTEYTFSVDADEDEVTISAETTDGNATVTGTGTYNPRTDGPVEIVVTSESGTTKTYTITFDVAESSNADLSDLGVTGYTIDPTFDKDTTEYNVTVPSDVDKATITAELADDRGSVTGFGEKDLDYGENSFDVVVTAEDGTTTKTYTVNITRTKKDIATLTTLLVDDVEVPGFREDKYEYDLGDVASDKTTIKIDATTTDLDATIEGTGTKNLQVGNNSFDVVITAQNGTTTKTYTIKVKRLQSDNSLATLTVSSDPAGTLSPAFDPETTTYTYVADPDETEITVSATVPDGSNATITGEGTYDPRTTDKVEIVVKAEDGTEKTYTINLELAKSSNADLSSLGVEGRTISPTFDKDTLEYTLTVSSDVESANIVAELADDRATLTGTGNKDLNYGSNPFEVKVTAEDGTTEKTYKVTITREKKTDATLSDIKVNGVSIQGFDPDTTEYTVDAVNSDVDSITLDATLSDPDATLTGTGTKTVQTGPNSFDIVVTAQDGETTKTYTVNVKKNSSDSSLSGITITSDPVGTFEPAFDPAVTEYTYIADPDEDEVVISATPNQDGAIVSGEGTFDPHDTDEVELIVTAEDGTTTTYIIHLENAKSTNANLSNLEVQGYTISPTFDEDTLSYTVTVPSDVDSAKIIATLADDRATKTGDGTKDLTYGSNNFDIVVTAEDGTTKKTYTVSIERELSSDVKLSDLKVDGDTIDGFDPDVPSYTLPDVGNDVDSITITGTPENDEATVEVVGADANGNVPLEVGENVIEVKVTAQDGSVGTYTITVTREADDNNDLKSLEVEGYDITPDFDKDETSYTLTVPSDVDSITVNAEPDADTATVTGTGSHDLQPGENTIEVKVKAEDGTEKTYTITVTKEEDDEKITSVAYGHTIEDGMIKSVEYKSVAETLKDQLDNENWKLHIFDKDDTAEIAEDKKLGTAMIIKLIKNDKVHDSDLLVVKGDVNGDGNIAVNDIVRTVSHYLETDPLEGIWLEAADMNSDGTIKVGDIVNIVSIYLED